MYQRRVVGLVLAVASCVTIFSAVWFRTWWVGVDGEESVRVGLRSAEVCQMRSSSDDDDASSYDDDYSSSSSRHRHARCHESSLRGFLDDDVADNSDDDALRRYGREQSGLDDDEDEPAPHPGKAFVVLGTLVFVAGLGAIVALIVAGATSGGPVRPRPATLIAAIVCGGFAGLALAFVVSVPSAMEVRAGPGLALALLGALGGVAASLTLAKSDPAREPTSQLLVDADRMAPISRAPGLIVGAIGTTLLLGTVFTNYWFHGKDEDGTSISVGVQDVNVCHDRDEDSSPSSADSDCQTRTIPPRVDRVDHPTRFKIFLAAGTMTLWTGLAASLCYVAIALLLMFRQSVGGTFALPRILYTAAGGFALAALVYAISFPKEDIERVSVSVGPFAAVGGAGCLIGAAVMIGRWMQSMQLAIPTLVAHDPSQPTFAPAAYGQPAFVQQMPMQQPLAPTFMPPSFAPPPAPTPVPFAQAPSPFAPSPFAPPMPPAPPTPPTPPTYAFSQPYQPTPAAPPPPVPIYAPPVPVPQVVIPACPRCGTPMLWISAKTAWQCTVCPRG